MRLNGRYPKTGFSLYLLIEAGEKAFKAIPVSSGSHSQRFADICALDHCHLSLAGSEELFIDQNPLNVCLFGLRDVVAQHLLVHAQDGRV